MGNRDGLTGTWVIEKKVGTGNVNFGEEVYIKNLYGTPTYLDACGSSGCGGGWEVSTTNLGQNRDGTGTGTWVFEEAEGQETTEIADAVAEGAVEAAVKAGISPANVGEIGGSAATAA